MNPHEISQIERVFARIAPNAKQAGRAFHERLFVPDPTLRALFRGEIGSQARLGERVEGEAE